MGINIKLSNFAPYKKIEEQIQSQGKLKYIKGKKTTLQSIVHFLVLTVFAISSVLLFVYAGFLLFDSARATDFISVLSLYRMAKAVRITVEFSAWVSSIFAILYGISKFLEGFYSRQIKPVTTLIACIFGLAESVGISVGIMALLTRFWDADFGNSFVAVSTLASLSIFFTYITISVVYFREILLEEKIKDIDDPEFKITSKDGFKDVKIDIIKNMEKFEEITGSKDLSEDKKKVYEREINKLNEGKADIKTKFATVIAVWAAVIFAPLTVPILLCNINSCAEALTYLSKFALWYSKEPLLGKAFYLAVITAINWFFSVFVHSASFCAGAVLGEVRLGSGIVTLEKNIKEKMLGELPNIIVNNFKQICISSSTINLLYAICTFPLSIIKSGYRAKAKSVASIFIEGINTILCLCSIMFSGFMSFFSAFKHFKLGMYSKEQIPVIDKTIFDADWKSYIYTCTVMFVIASVVLMILAAVFSTLYSIDSPVVTRFCENLLEKMNSVSLRALAVIFYTIFMILFCLIPTTVEIIKERPAVGRSFVERRILIGPQDTEVQNPSKTISKTI
ncbi:hypothetical protein NEMIN01_1603 [Nematocida minor]|uniref:uncharacterized protein n=1 Tax=Nematocida minor TaxID=1912983 RepID=UPI00221E7C28|nr:uncharacterized protein NEMIN01_1603 [Nematocida minor]KAI5191619.1 hypothetical protein NEMIN01_1603 [Nematocida minor]